MISLRKHIDSYRDALTESSIAAFRSTLVAIARCGQRAVPGVGGDLNEKLARIQQGLPASLTPGDMNEACRRASDELSSWAEQAFQHHEENEREIREIIGAMASTAESVSERDERYARELGGVANRLRTAAEAEDIATIRRSILESSHALNACMEKMAEDGKASILQLNSQIGEYRSRLRIAERNSSLDALTELANRRAFERQLTIRTSGNGAFCLILLDLDDFKGVNDRYGHPAGDDLLRQFATELRAQFTADDLVARWGGDEFAVISSGTLARGASRWDRVRRWTLGEYKVRLQDETVRVSVGASAGIVEWNGSETGDELVIRADKEVYRAKQEAKVQNGSYLSPNFQRI